MLILFAFFLIVFVPLVFLLFNYGLATLTRRQMQAAANTAALEGMRFRDQVPAAWRDSMQAPEELIDMCGTAPDDEDTEEAAEWRDCARRWAARNVAALLYDGNLDLDAGDADGFAYSRTLDFGDDQLSYEQATFGRYRPELQLNRSNEAYGDMVAGNYHADGLHHEATDYQRSDFTADNSPTADAMLVRLRRTADSTGAASTLDRSSDVSSTGPAIPWLWGRGWDHGEDDPPSRIVDGTQLRATAIAQARPAMTVGVSTDPNRIGLAPFWISRDIWNALPIDGEETIDEFIEPTVTTIGMTLQASVAVAVDGSRYIPIYDDELGSNIRVIGFGLCEVVGVDLELETVTIKKLPSAIAHQNASAAPLFPEHITPEILQMHQEVDQSLLAPALVRSVK